MFHCTSKKAHGTTDPEAELPCTQLAKHGHDVVTDAGEVRSGAQLWGLGSVKKKITDLKNDRFQKKWKGNGAVR